MNTTRRIFVALLCLVASLPLAAATYIVPDDGEFVNRAEAIVIAHGVDSFSRPSQLRGIETVFRLQVEEVLKGDLPTGDLLEIAERGGINGQNFIIVPGTPSYRSGERVVVFLRRDRDGQWTTSGMSLGKFTFRTDGDEKLLMREGDIEGWTPEGQPHVERFRDEPGFLRFVRSTISGEPVAADYFVDLAEFTAKDGGMELQSFPPSQFLFKVGNGDNFPFRGVRWATPVATFRTQGVQTGKPNSVNNAASAAQFWNDSSISSVQLNVSGITTVGGPVLSDANGDGQNSIVFNDPFNEITDPSVSATGIFTANTNLNTKDGESFYTIVEGDVVVARTSVQSEAGFVTLLAHEIGHTLGIRHANGTRNTGSYQGDAAPPEPSTSDAVMAFPIPLEFTSPRTWDRLAVSTVYGNGLPCTASITQQPASHTIPNNTSTQLSVAATSNGPLTYQWFEGTTNNEANSTLVPGATSASFTTPVLTSTRSYWVKVITDCGVSVPSQVATVTVQAACTPIVITSQPQDRTILTGQSSNITVGHTGSTPATYQWFSGVPGHPLSPVQNSNSVTLNTGPLTQNRIYRVNITNACTFPAQESRVVTVTVTQTCTQPTIQQQPQSVSILLGTSTTLSVTANGTSPLNHQWFTVVNNQETAISGQTNSSLNVAPTATTTYRVRVTNSCGNAVSQNATVTVQQPCGLPAKPDIEAPSTVAANVDDYTVSWSSVAGAGRYFLEEASNPEFTGATRTDVGSSTSRDFDTPNVTTDRTLYYRVQAEASCNSSFRTYSDAVRVIILAPVDTSIPPIDGLRQTAPFGTNEPATFTFTLFSRSGKGHIGLDDDDTFEVKTDKSFITASPSSGTIPPQGVNVTVTVTTTGLPVGATTGTVTATNPTTGTQIVSVPVSMTLNTPVSPGGKTLPPPNALIIPGVAHVDSSNSQFQSDVRVTNTSNRKIRYQLTFTPTQANGTTSGHQSSIEINPNQTVALNDIVKEWYGLYKPGDQSNGALEIRPLDFDGKFGTEAVSPFATIAASRTFALKSTGTLGQFIPAVPFSKFLGKSADPLRPTRLSLQQIAQSSAYRTNLGFIEGSGQPVSLLVKLVDTRGQQLFSFTENLQAGEHKQLNSTALKAKGMPDITDGRFEIQVTSDTGRITAFASVLDNRSDDPLLVSPVDLSTLAAATRYALPGIADLTNTNASWRSDVRILNPNAATVNAIVTYYPQTPSGQTINARSTTIPIQPGEIKVIDDTLKTLFGLSNSGGSLIVSMPTATPLVATARTYDKRVTPEKTETYGQFIPAVSPAEATGLGDASLNILQLEQSPRFRTNVGLAEVSGKQAVVQVTVILPDSPSASVREFTLRPNEFTQIPMSALLPLTAYNARVTVKVIGGEGRVTAYGSVIDNLTQDPTYVPAQ